MSKYQKLPTIRWGCVQGGTTLQALRRFVPLHTFLLRQCLRQFIWSNNTFNNRWNGWGEKKTSPVCCVLRVRTWHTAAGLHDSLMVRRLLLPCNTTLSTSGCRVEEQAATLPQCPHPSVTLAPVSCHGQSATDWKAEGEAVSFALLVMLLTPRCGNGITAREKGEGLSPG